MSTKTVISLSAKADPAVKQLIVRLLERNSGIRDIEQILQVSWQSVLKSKGAAITISPRQLHYRSIQIDEVWSYVTKRKQGKYWLFYAYRVEHAEIIGYICGSKVLKRLGV